MSTQLKDLRMWEKCSPCPIASTADAFIIQGDDAVKDVLYVSSNTNVLEYSPTTDGWTTLPSPALAGTFGPGSCGVFHPKSFTLTAASGSGGTAWNDTYSGGNSGATFKTTLTLLTDLRRPDCYTGGLNSLMSGRILVGAEKGQRVNIVGNDIGDNASIYLILDTGGAPTIDTSTVIEFYTGRFYILNAGTVAAGSFKYFDYATQTWSGNLSVSGLPGTWGTSGAMEITVRRISLDNIYVMGDSGSTTTVLQYTGATPFTTNELVGMMANCTNGNNNGERRLVTANTTNTVTVASAFPSSTVGDTFYLRGNNDIIYLIGNNAVTMYTYTISTNTWATITPSGARGAAPGNGCNLSWVSYVHLAKGTTSINMRKMVSFRGGGSNVADIYDIGTKTWSVLPYGKQAEVVGVASSWAGDMTEYMYCQINPVASEPPKVVAYSFKDNSLLGYGALPLAAGTVVNGQRLFIIHDGVWNSASMKKYLYYLMPSSTKLYRTEIY